MNADSLKADDEAGYQLEFDIYTDDQISAIARDGKKISDDRHNATVTAIYNESNGQWEIDHVDFETYAQDPKN